MNLDVKTKSVIIVAKILKSLATKSTEKVTTLFVAFFFLFRSEVQIEMTKIENKKLGNQLVHTYSRARICMQRRVRTCLCAHVQSIFSVFHHHFCEGLRNYT